MVRGPIANKGKWLAASVATLALTVAAPAQADVIVSLGDSYSSGEGARDKKHPEWDAHTSANCHRSANAWPRLLGVTKNHHFACSGAKVPDVLTRGGSNKPDNVPQIVRLAALDKQVEIDTVLMTIGGNDMKFAGTIRSCYIPLGECLSDRDKIERKLDKLDKLEPKLVDAYEKVADATSGDLVVVGYPDLIPGKGETFHHCGWVSKDEKKGLRAFQDGLDRTISQAADEAGVDYIAIRDALDGHELCTEHSWMNKIGALGGSKRGHPTARGQKAIRKQVRAGLDEL